MLVLAVTLVLGATACSRGGAGEAPPAGAAPAAGGRGGRGERGGGAAIAVTTATAVGKPMPVNVRAVGNVEPSTTVEVRSQVSGQLLAVGFKEGEDVAAGQLLFTIDPRPFEVAVQQAEAALARDTAQAQGLQVQLTRSEELLRQELTPKASRDQLATQYAMSQASIAVDKAQLENAKLQLQYTKIVAPIAGRTGALLVHQGSLVRPNDASPLVVINQLAPAFVSFAVPSRLLPDIRSEQRRGGLKAFATTTGETTPSAAGVVTFVDNAVDQNSDTVRLKATFDNANRRLWPGQFVDVTLQLSVKRDAVVVPVAALQAGQDGQFVYVVKADSTVDARPVTVAWIAGDEVVLDTGVQPGDVVVTDGQLRLVPGARVSRKPGADSPRSAS